MSMSHQKVPVTRSQSGFTLIEMMVAIIVLSIGLLGMAGLQAATAKYRVNTLSRSATSNLVFDLSERIRSNADAAGPSFIQTGSTDDSSYVLDDSWADQQSTTVSVATDCATAECTAAQRADYDMKTWRLRLRAAVPQGAALVSGNKRDGFVATIMWFDKEYTDGSSNRVMVQAPTCQASLTGMATQTCCPAAAEAPAGVRCSRFSFVP